MKKTYPLHVEGTHNDRVLDAVKNDIRKYIKRERSKPLVEGVDFWDFACRMGISAEAAAAVHPGNLMETLDAIAQGGAAQCYVEILAQAGRRTAKPREQASQGDDGAARSSATDAED
jgi:Family of unknown function (DUF6172)